jgi:hypothetical protein
VHTRRRGGFVVVALGALARLAPTFQEPGLWLMVRATSFKLLTSTLQSLEPIG